MVTRQEKTVVSASPLGSEEDREGFKVLRHIPANFLIPEPRLQRRRVVEAVYKCSLQSCHLI